MKEGWTYKKLGEVCDIFGRIGFRGYTREDYVNTIEEGAISLSPSNIINNRLDFSDCTYITWDKYSQSPEIMISKGDVIFVKTASVGKCAFVSELPHESTINPQFVVFKNIKISNRFLFHELLSPTFQYKVQRIKSGTSVPTITQKGLSELEISYPPIAEQERIVAELDLLQGIIEKKKEQLKAYDQLAQSIFYIMFGDPVTNEKGWQVKKLGEICENCDSMRKPITAKDREQGEIPYYGASGIVDYVKDYIFDGDYLLISEDGANLIARSTPIAFSIKGKTWVNNHAHVLKFTNQITQQYVEFSINLRDVSAIVTGCAQPKLTQANLNRILISFPPLSLQEEFAEKVESIERQKALVQQSIEETQTMFDFTMDKYFG